jgi:hypothetical protein
MNEDSSTHGLTPLGATEVGFMSAVVQATCPGCRQVLRIPADWLGKPIRCKHCGTALHTKQATPAPPPAPPAGIPEPPKRKAAPPAKALQADRRGTARSKGIAAQKSTDDNNGSPFSDLFEEEGETGGTRRRGRRGSGWWKGALVALGVLVISGGLLAFTWTRIVALLKTPEVAQLIEDIKDIKPGPKEPAKNPDPVKAEEPPRPVSSFPRRMLVISVHDYLFANPIPAGMPEIAGTRVRNVRSLVDKLGDGFKIPPPQRAHLSDRAANDQARPPMKPVIEKTLTDFLEGSRAQDRLLVFFIGHSVEIDDEAYLVPIEGDLESATTLIPLKWVFEQLKVCKARQKVLVLDVNHVNPTRGQERPGGGPMGPKLDEALKGPPPGVQVWSSCSGGQMSYETESSQLGVFLDGLYKSATEGVQGKIQKPEEPFPLEYFRDAVNKAVTDELGSQQREQASRLSGQEAEGGAPNDPMEEAAPSPVLAGTPTGAGAITPMVARILDEVELPPVKVVRAGDNFKVEWLPPFPDAAMREYRPSPADSDEQKKVRQTIRNARVVLWAVSTASPPSGLATPVKRVKDEVKFDLSILQDGYRFNPNEKQFKDKVFNDEKNVARILDRLNETLEDLKGIEGLLDKEGKRWRANYDFIRARAEMQLAYVIEYQSMLGQMRKELPPRDPKVHGGWRLASTSKLQGDSAGKKLASSARKALDKIIQDCGGTPWELLAKRERLAALGLEWQPAK